MKAKKYVGLCYRCEHRAKYLESVSAPFNPRPRYECGAHNCNKLACYMYQPVKPVVLKKMDKRDKRPQFGPAIISARSMGAEIRKDIVLDLKKYRGGGMLYWVPKE